MNRPLIFFGLLTLAIGLGVGYMIYTHPEGLNPAWPLWMALFAPGVFVLGGLHLIAAGLGQPSLAVVMIRAILICFFAIIHWAAFFTTSVQCLVTVSFLGSAVFGWHPGEAECRNSLRVIVAAIDALVIAGLCVFAWQQRRSPSREISS